MFRNAASRLVPVAIATLWVGVGSALAFEPVDQSRSVHGFVIVPQCGQVAFDDEEAEGFEPFGARAGATGDCDSASARAVAGQRSSISQVDLMARGRAASRADASLLDIIHAIADSTYSVTFEVETQTQYTLRGLISAAASDDNIVVLAGATVRLVDAVGQVLADYAVEPGPGGALQRVVVDQRGILEPGEHTLTTTATTVIDNEVPPSRAANATFELLFRTLPDAP